MTDYPEKVPVSVLMSPSQTDATISAFRNAAQAYHTASNQPQYPDGFPPGQGSESVQVCSAAPSTVVDADWTYAVDTTPGRAYTPEQEAVRATGHNLMPLFAKNVRDILVEEGIYGLVVEPGSNGILPPGATTKLDAEAEFASLNRCEVGGGLGSFQMMKGRIGCSATGEHHPGHQDWLYVSVWAGVCVCVCVCEWSEANSH